MKKIFLTLLLPILLNIGNAHAQGCLPNGITFTTQAQINSFPTDYPGCTIIDGNVGITGNNITNIDSLIQITKINGSLQILNAGGLTNLDGFENLTHVQGLISIKNTTITNITGLNNLDSIGGSLKIERCYQSDQRCLSHGYPG